MLQKDNSGKRQMTMLLQLLDGQQLNKKELELMFGVSPRTIQNDIAQIKQVLEECISQRYDLLLGSSNLIDSLTDRFQVQLRKSGEGGQYFVKENIAKLSSFGNLLSANESFAILKILLESRALSNDEMFGLIDSIVQIGDNNEYLKNSILNERFHYKGVPDSPLLEILGMINDAIEQQLEISFDYTKNFVTHHFKKLPEQLYFQDLYFYMVSDHHTSQDDRDLTNLNKFRVNNMKNIQLHGKRRKLDYNNRFQAGILRNNTGVWGYFGKPITLSIEFYYDPVYVLDRFPGAKIISQHFDDDRQQVVSRIDIATNDGYGVKMWLLMQSDQLKILSPKSVRDYVIQSARNMLNYYSEDLEKK
ncbi:helix-turn-helix transcriptional regulator [Streptococcus sp. S784/96/1]|uniref:helix-turn-helix transcriptional regulator n=1 Tax=Streptococcus sp. S784/96/1 TaxID=2653499 RepID=UPI0013895941|nr:WYL domain-containing protein [Streptococcus sp. S784/96/1]